MYIKKSTNRFRFHPVLTIGSQLLLILSLFLFPGTATAQSGVAGTSEPVRHFDHVINKKGESRISVFTGLPVVGSTEYAYGISDKLTFGVFAGFTPFEEALGIRVRTELFERADETFRIYYCTPIIFYPQSQRADPDAWFITRPNINFEWVASSGLRYKVGGSLLAMASHRDLFGDGTGSKHPPELWTAVHVGTSMPVGRGSGLSFQAELSYITKGVKTIDSFVGGPPIILMTGFSFEL